MTGDGTARHNPNARTPNSLSYPRLRWKYLRTHIDAAHAFDGDAPIIHIPATLEGVAP